MPRHCTICNHPRLREITSELMARHPLRSIQTQYDVSKSALDRHINHHVMKALRKLTVADVPMAMAAEIGKPVLVEMRKLNGRSLSILKAAEDAKDHATALHAVRECRRNLELIAKLTGELHPLAPGEAAAGGGLNVTVTGDSCPSSGRGWRLSSEDFCSHAADVERRDGRVFVLFVVAIPEAREIIKSGRG